MMPLPPIQQGPCPDGVQFSLQVATDHPAFQGHFPNWPVLPGVIQVDWAIRLGMQAFGIEETFCGLRNLKFQGIIQPPCELKLVLQHNPLKRTMTFIYTENEKLRSSGILCFT